MYGDDDSSPMTAAFAEEKPGSGSRDGKSRKISTAELLDGKYGFK